LLDDAGEEVIGTLVMFGNSAHKRVAGEKEDLGTFEREEERVQALEKHFGIKLSESQKGGIVGMVSAI
jgi:hypothetical protein